MIDLNDKYLGQIEKFLQQSMQQCDTIDDNDLDPREIIYQTIEAVKTNTYTYGDVRCVPNIITISFPETKCEKAEDLETIFSEPEFITLFENFLANQQIRVFNPLRVEVETVSKGNSRVMYRRAALALDWPGPEMSAEDVRVTLDPVKKQITSIQPPRPQISQLARLTALNADVYQNNYIITKPFVFIGRMRSVINEDNGKLIRRNDFVFAHHNTINSIGNSVSRQHATIKYNNNIFSLFDHGSANGTLLQRGTDRPKEFVVTPQFAQGVPLEHGDMIRFGSAWVHFEMVPMAEADNQLQFGLTFPVDPPSLSVRNTRQVDKRGLSPADRSRLDNAIRRTRE